MLSVIIIAKNEEHLIKTCLESVSWADEIIVLDSGSTDNTVTIAKKYTPHVFETDWQGYGVQKQRALEKASGDWVLNLDADEYVDDGLKQTLLQVMAADTADACRIPIQMYFYGKPLRYSSSPSRHIRLFKRVNARYSQDIVHEKILIPETYRIAQLQQAIKHHSFRDLSHALFKMNRYSSYSAKIRLEEGKQVGFAKTLLATAWMFFRCYFLQRGFLDGKAGLIFAALNAQGTFYRGLKQIYPDTQTIAFTQEESHTS